MTASPDLGRIWTSYPAGIDNEKPVGIKAFSPGFISILFLRKAERGNEVIQLHFCSPELLRNSRTRLSKSYEGNISDIVRKV